MRVRYITNTAGNTLCAAIWFLSCIVVVDVIGSRKVIEFDPKYGGCVFPFEKSVIHIIITLFTTVIPFIGITCSNIALWVYVHRYRRAQKLKDLLGTPQLPQRQRVYRRTLTFGENLTRFRKQKVNQTVLTTCSITTLFVVAWFPTIFRYLLSSIIGEKNIPNWVEKCRYLYFIGTYGNPVIYTMVNKSFRALVISKLRKFFRIKKRNTSMSNMTNLLLQYKPLTLEERNVG